MASVELSSPLRLPSGLELPNRIGKAAMSENLATSSGKPTDQLVKLYERFGSAGAGLLITGNVQVDPGGRTEPNNVVLMDERQSDASAELLRRWAKAAKAGGSKVLVQVSHAGRQTPRNVTWRPVAPSPVPLQGMGGFFSKPTQLTVTQIDTLVRRFGRTAALVSAAGFDGVQIHGAHGYLVSQFLSPLTNLRDDRYGGDLEGRMRFLLEIVRAVRRETSPGFTVAVKLNSADFQRGGFDLESSMKVAAALEAEGIDLLEVSGGSYEKPAMMGSERKSTREREAFFLEYAERIREVVSLPLMVTGGFRSRQGMTDALASGAVDVIGMARPLAVRPELAGELVRGDVAAAPDHPISVGSQLLDGMLELAWHQRQMTRMSLGLDPSENLGVWGLLASHLGRMAAQYVRAGVLRDGHALEGSKDRPLAAGGRA